MRTNFDGRQPLVFFEQCHADIREHCTRLEVLFSDIERGETAQHVRERAEAIVDFFEHAAQQHHEDEETVFFPRLCRLEVETGQRLDLARLIDSLQSDHRTLDALWLQVRIALTSARRARHSDMSEEVRTFVTAHRHHMGREDAGVLPMAHRYFDDDAMHAMGLAIVERRLRALGH